MRLPVFDPHTNRLTSYTLEKADLFNPISNPVFDLAHTDDTAQRRLISVGTVYNYCKDIMPYFTVDEFEQSIAQRNSSSNYGGHLFNPVFKQVYESLPADYKWAIFYTYIAPVRDVTPEGSATRVHEFKAVIRKIDAVTYNESEFATDVVKFNVSLTTARNDVLFTDEQKQDLVNKLSAIDFADFEARFTIRLDRLVYAHERLVPYHLALAYDYAHDLPCFSPRGDDENYSIPVEVLRPSQLSTFIHAGVKLTPHIFDDNSGFYYTEVVDPANMRRKFERVLSYSTNVLNHLPYTIKGPKEQTATLYGVELEANSEYTPKQVMDAQKDLFFLLKQDSSISGMYSQNYEMVTVPCSLRAHKRLWAEFFESIDYQKFDVTNNTGNGMHVHIDRKTFEKSKKHLDRFTWFFINPSHSAFVFAMSERPTRHDLDKWSPIAHVQQSGKIYHNIRKASRLNHGRGAVHYKGNTVEIRIFKGLVSYATIIKNLEFVDSVVEFTRMCSTQQLTLANYIAWVKTTPKNKYELLKAYFEEIKIHKLLIPAELDQYLWGQTNEFIITKMLNKAPFTVTTDHLTILNRRKKRRTYVLKNGVVQCITKNTGALSKFDILAQKKQTRGSSTFLTAAL